MKITIYYKMMSKDGRKLQRFQEQEVQHKLDLMHRSILKKLKGIRGGLEREYLTYNLLKV